MRNEKNVGKAERGGKIERAERYCALYNDIYNDWRDRETKVDIRSR